MAPRVYIETSAQEGRNVHFLPAFNCYVQTVRSLMQFYVRQCCSSFTLIMELIFKRAVPA